MSIVVAYVVIYLRSLIVAGIMRLVKCESGGGGAPPVEIASMLTATFCPEAYVRSMLTGSVVLALSVTSAELISASDRRAFILMRRVSPTADVMLEL